MAVAVAGVVLSAISMSSRAGTLEIPLGNLFDDSKETSLPNAIATDTYGAIADETDLGVLHVFRDLTVPTPIGGGLSFDFAGAGATIQWADPVMNDASVESPPSYPPGVWPIRTLGMPIARGPGQRIEQGIGMHANNAIVFDLDALRSAGGLGSTASMEFSAAGAVNDSAIGQRSEFRLVAILSGAHDPIAYVNGQPVEVVYDNEQWGFSDPLGLPSFNDNNPLAAFDIDVSGDSRYLTLASISMGAHSWDHSVFANAMLTIVSLAGDVDSDGVVGLEDLNLVRNHFGESGQDVPGDADGNGRVTLVDLNLVRNHFGTAAGAAAVPEPSSLGLLAAAIACFASRVRRMIRPGNHGRQSVSG